MAGNPNITEIGHATRFKPGQSGNPQGRATAYSISRLIRLELEKPAFDGAPMTNGELLASMIVAQATRGSIHHQQLVLKYIDGEPKDVVRLTVDEMIENVASQYNLDPAKVRERFERDTGIAS